MRLLLVTRRLAPDAHTPLAGAMADLHEDARRNLTVDLVAGYVRDRELLPAGALGVDLCGRRGLGAAWAMRRAAATATRRHDPHVILTTDPAVRRHGRPSLVWVHRPPAAPPASLRDRARLARLASFDGVVATSERLAASLVEAGLDPARLHVLPPALDAERFRGVPPAGDTLQLAVVGRIAPERGIHVAIDAVARLSPVEKARVHLRVVGRITDPVYAEQLRMQAHRQPVSFHPDVDHVGPFYRQAHLILYPTLVEEPVPFGALEGLAGGIPVVWSDRPEIREAVLGHGIPVPPGDVPALRAVLRAALDDLAPLHQAARAACAALRAVRGREVLWARWEALLRTVAAG